MITFYMVALGAGGTLVLMTLLLGGDSHADADLDSPDFDPDVDAHVGVGDVLESWLPLASFRFWTFFLAFFGLAGTLFTASGSLGKWPGALAAGAVGYGAGLFMTKLMKNLRKSNVDSKLSSNDWIGQDAKVVIPLEKGALGKIRMSVKGRTVEVMAESEQTLKQNEDVVVYGVSNDGHALVERSEQLLN